MDGDPAGSKDKKPTKKKGLLASDSESEDETGRTRKGPFKPVPRGRKGSIDLKEKSHKSPMSSAMKERKSPYGEKKGEDSKGRKSPFGRTTSSDREGKDPKGWIGPCIFF